MDIEKRNKRQYQWQKENTDRLNFTMPKGTKEKIKQAAKREGVTPSEFVRAAIDDRLNAGKLPKEPPPEELQRIPFED